MSLEDKEESEEEMVAPKVIEMHVPEQQEKEQTVASRREEYAEVVRDKQQIEEEIKDKKVRRKCQISFVIPFLPVVQSRISGASAKAV